MSVSSKSKWTQIIIRDAQALPGKSLFDVIKFFKNLFGFKCLVLNDIVGSAQAAAELRLNEGKVLDIDVALKIIQEVKQFDWGDFFLFSAHPVNFSLSEDGDYPQLIVQTDTTIRAVDDTYLYIYTPEEQVVDLIKEKYIVESLKIDLLENLDYPY